MKKAISILVVCVMLYVRSAPTNSEIVWLKDVTSSFETDQRTLSDPYLPDELTFHLSRGSHALTLNLEMNHGIDPNANVYVVRKSKDGRSFLEKTRNLENEDLAYYQDRENGAFMTVRCVRRSNGQCERVINGNIRIGDSNYDLRPAETNVTSSRNLLDVPDLLGTQYVLHDQTNIQRAISIEKSKDAVNVNEKNVEHELIGLLRRSTHEQEKRNYLPSTNSALSSRNVADFNNTVTIDKKDNVKQVYWVEVAVLTDSTIWDFYSSLIQTNDVPVEEVHSKRRIREAYSHIINGVILRYNEMEDTSIKISVTLRDFYIFQSIEEFTHISSRVETAKGKTYIDANNYLDDISNWDSTIGSKFRTDYDHAMLFTRHDLYDADIHDTAIRGLSNMGRICDTGERVSVVEESDYFLTVNRAAHELGHNLGADHDGYGNAKACKFKDVFILSPTEPVFDPNEPYSRTPWMFSRCSVETFKKTLKNKKCLTNTGVFFNKTEWMKYVMRLPGEVYTLNEQCELIHGPISVFCGVVSADICRFMQCSSPKTRKCLSKLFSVSQHFNAAEGTSCGKNMWCIEGRCVSKASE